ncbi:MAG: gamma-glutamyl-gamma-aminobutyrate hydrolase family protein [Oscillospiraceae bacterium]|jgi:putative glutamine amidotransferase|nr:gamma-glutamyl-gamma-aminobutyrate hydrolase family protein [Oscillospiraceae bacterium]
MDMPVVGIIPLVDAGRESLWMLPAYMEGVTHGGGLPVMLPLTDREDQLERMLELCDGFLFTGGHDVSPDVYGEETLPVCGELCPGRDRMEKPLLLEALARDKSILGICRGLQFLNAALGGTLYQDLSAQRPTDCSHRMAAPYDRPEHPAVLTEGAPLRRLLDSASIGVNSCHHQAVRDLAPGLSVMAEAPDGVVEAVWMPGKRFVWAVQWHPEFSYYADANSRRIFNAFVESMKKQEDHSKIPNE